MGGAAGTAGTRAAPRAAVLRRGVQALLAEATGGASGRPAHVVDLGGGTGGYAVPLAGEGHRVTVVDPSPDALAALARRAREAGVADAVTGVQGDAERLGDVLEAGSADLVLCHGVLEVVDDVSVSLAALRAVLRDGGRLSLLLAQRSGAVLARASAGHLRQAWAISQDPAGRWGPDDPLQRRFDAAAVPGLLASAGFSLLATEGVRALADLVPQHLVEAEPDLVARLEEHAGASPDLSAIAPQLHVRAATA